MKTNYRALAMAAFVVSLFAGFAAAQGPPPEITEHHKILHKDLGTWKGTMKIFMPGQDNPMEMPITETNTKFGDGLWVMTEFDGGPFQGRGSIGYDPNLKKYVGTWQDNMSPVLMTMTGDYDKETGVLTTLSNFIDTHTKKKKFTKSISKHNEDGTRTYEMFERATESDEWRKSFEINYKKAE